MREESVKGLVFIWIYKEYIREESITEFVFIWTLRRVHKRGASDRARFHLDFYREYIREESITGFVFIWTFTEST